MEFLSRVTDRLLEHGYARAQAAIDAAGLRVTQVRDNPQYQFISKSAQGATREYGVKSVSLVATRD